MSQNVIHALVLIQNWGDDSEILRSMVSDRHIISIFHIMGRHSYLLDVNFDDKKQLSGWIGRMKSTRLSSGIPAIISIQTQKIIDVHKQKEAFSLKDYMDMKERSHFFVKIDNPHDDEALLEMMKKSPIVHSVLHVQGENSFTIEVIVDDYSNYKKLLKKMKGLKSVHHIETQEVISVIKYRNQIIDEMSDLIKPDMDTRELYTL
ncbi:MAG: hypothetical protein MUD12_15960 [Spirochaetes bacterium]|nr:hypothetical protein [Spirochaetota bacterium]